MPTSQLESTIYQSEPMNFGRYFQKWRRYPMTEGPGQLVVLDSYRAQYLTITQQENRLKSGGGGGTSDGMEGRVDRLESRVDKLISDVSDIRADLATLTERVAHLPGKGFIITAIGTSVTILGAIVLLADRLKTLVS